MAASARPIRPRTPGAGTSLPPEEPPDEPPEELVVEVEDEPEPPEEVEVEQLGIIVKLAFPGCAQRIDAFLALRGYGKSESDLPLNRKRQQHTRKLLLSLDFYEKRKAFESMLLVVEQQSDF